VKQKLNDASVQNRFRAKLLALWPALKGSLAEVVGGGVKVVEKRRFENPAGVSLERSNSAMSV
jgi:hypothetical protein